jgi:uncharacterized repeat protein (TIGR04076 family)
MIKITVMKIVEHKDLMEKYENPIEHACSMKVGMEFYLDTLEKPSNMCDSAWEIMYPFIKDLFEGKNNFFDGWMKDKNSAMISCNDGFRPVSFYIEKITGSK